MTTPPAEALPPVADGEMPYTPWSQIDVRTTLFNVYRTILTPDGAREWMAHNVVNRAVEASTVRAYRRIIKDEEWLVFDPFLFCAPSGVISGANRMTAIAAGETAVEVLVQVGNPESIRWAVDAHRNRMHAQNLAMRKVANPRTVSALAAAVWKLEKFRFIRQAGGLKEKPLPFELDAVLEQHPEVHRYAEVAWQTYWGVGRKETPTVLGLALWMMTKDSSDPGPAIEFMRQLAHEPQARPLAVATEDDVPPSPAALLRRRLTSASYTKSSLSELTRVAQIIEAWNATVAGDREWAPPILKQAASVPTALHPGNEYPALLLEPMSDARTWRSAA
ncbi:hypothetical protein ACFVGM_09055 [Kitasatospora purpeofusca]|uniref:hypothetical protein n=1 Tax=Kitasatospora purpeofusca TaxID=67352 RepID=UPI0036CFE2E2